VFLSLDTVNARIALSFGSIATQSQTYSEPALIIVSSIINSATFFLFDDIFWGWYFWIQFQTETWFRLTKHESRSDVLLKDRPEKYKYNP